MRKYIYLIILLFFCFGFSSPHHRIIARKNAAGEVNQEAGYSTVGGTEAATATDRCVKFTTAGAMTVSYGYFYGNYNGTGNDLMFGVFENNAGAVGSQVGGCSDGGDLPQSTVEAWHERTWSSNYPALSASTTYFLCRYTDTDVDEFRDAGPDGTAFYASVDPGGCGTTMATASTYYVTMTVSNYDAH